MGTQTPRMAPGPAPPLNEFPGVGVGGCWSSASGCSMLEFCGGGEPRGSEGGCPSATGQSREDGRREGCFHLERPTDLSSVALPAPHLAVGTRVTPATCFCPQGRCSSSHAWSSSPSRKPWHSVNLKTPPWPPRASSTPPGAKA